MREPARKFALCAVSAMLVASGFTPPASAAPESCVVIDTDFDIDDLMSIPAVVGSRHVAAVVTTEGFTLAPMAASAVERLLAEPGQRPVPVIAGAGINRPEPEIAETFGDFVPVFRTLMNRLNNFLPTALPPAPVPGDVTGRVVAAVEHCAVVDVLVLGPFTSYVAYSPALRPKLGRVVISGRPLEGDSELEAVESFNCGYDHPSCATAFYEQLPGLDHTFVDVPRSDCDLTPNAAGCVGTVYGPTLAMVRGLGDAGLPNTLKQILLNHPESWAVDTWEQSPYGGRSLFWDQSAALALLDPGSVHPVGAHVETALSPQEFQARWTEYTNRSATYA